MDQDEALNIIDEVITNLEEHREKNEPPCTDCIDHLRRAYEAL